ncbi:OmpA family protein [candidate division WOR-3 bacterium]|nr:OmpA family protein [candidate division WOR-3 bacterium]
MAQLLPGTYSLAAEAAGYLKQTATLVVEQNRSARRDFALVKEGMTLTLRGVYFDLGLATIRSASRAALEDAARTLQENPDVKVEIRGHTDSYGAEEMNLALSQRRAQAVVNYLVNNLSCDQARLTAKGYGESQPVADNNTPEGRALNRRVEFVIVEQTEQR